MRQVSAMKSPTKTVMRVLTALVLAGSLPFHAAAKSYTSGGHSYSSHSSSSHSSSSHGSSFGGGHSSSGSHSFSSGSSHSAGGSSSHGTSLGSGSHSSGGGSSRSTSSEGGHSFRSSSGKSYSAGSTGSDSSRKSYTSGKSYSSGFGRTFDSLLGTDGGSSRSEKGVKRASEPAAGGFSFDAAAARARKEEASKTEFQRFQASQVAADGSRQAPGAGGAAPSYQAKPPPIPVLTRLPAPHDLYIPDAGTIATRPVRIYHVFNPYASRPVVIYRDRYSSLFWWWLLDRSLDDRAWWAYHHRYNMDPARYEALVASDQQLQARIDALENQQAARDPNYVPAGLDRDLMYSDHYVAQAYSNRPTTAGVVAFWLLGVPTASALCWLFIWLVWFKRWPTSAQPA